MPVDEARRALLLGAAALLLGRPARASTDSVEIVTRRGERLRFSIEWARTAAEKAQGLMHRQHLPDRHGMLFDLGETRRATFWMRNTPLSLDLMFVGENNRIAKIHERAQPFSESLIDSGTEVRWVLEVLGGTSKRLGIAVGDELVLPPSAVPAPAG